MMVIAQLALIQVNSPVFAKNIRRNNLVLNLFGIVLISAGNCSLVEYINARRCVTLENVVIAQDLVIEHVHVVRVVQIIYHARKIFLLVTIRAAKALVAMEDTNVRGDVIMVLVDRAL